MASVAPTSPSSEHPSRIGKLIAREIELLRARRRRLHERQDELRRRLGELDRVLEELDDRQHDLQHALATAGDEAGRGTAVPPLLGGAHLRRHAVAHLIATRQHGPIHYREWAEQLAAEGVVIRGADPAATLLTNITRSPLITRGEKPGTYRLDPEAAHRIKALLVTAKDRIRPTNGSQGVTADRARRLRALVSRLESAQAEIAECHRLARQRPSR